MKFLFSYFKTRFLISCFKTPMRRFKLKIKYFQASPSSFSIKELKLILCKSFIMYITSSTVTAEGILITEQPCWGSMSITKGLSAVHFNCFIESLKERVIIFNYGIFRRNVIVAVHNWRQKLFLLLSSSWILDQASCGIWTLYDCLPT